MTAVPRSPRTTTRLRLLAVVATCTAAGLLPVAGAQALADVAPSTTASAAASSFRIIGYQQSGDPLTRIDRDKHALTDVGVDGVSLAKGGAALGTVDAGTLAQLKRAHADGLRAELLLSGWNNAINDFDEKQEYALLSKDANRKRIAAALVKLVKTQGWDGITVDLESLLPRDTTGLVAFLQLLHAELPAKSLLGIDLQLNGSLAGYQQNGYNLTSIGQLTDEVALMAYDENGPWVKTPGPVDALPWQKRGLSVLLKYVPRGKVELGTAGYGYAWLAGPKHVVRTVSDRAARTLVTSKHGKKTWNATAGEWTATLPDGSTIWWADVRSISLRVTLAKQMHLRGVAIWSIAQADVIRKP